MSVSAPSACSNVTAARRAAFAVKPFVAVLLLASLLAGCSRDTTKESGTIAWSEPRTSTAEPGSLPPGPPLNWQTTLSGDTITVEIRDANEAYRVEQVELIGPGGGATTAYEINRTTNHASGDYYPYGGGSSVGVGVGGWGGSRSGTSVGIGIGFPLGGGSREPAPPPGTVTTARVRIPDMGLYRQTESWTIRVALTDRNGQPTSAVVPAPRPAS